MSGHKFVHRMNSSTETGDLNQLKYVNLRVLNQTHVWTQICPQNLVNSSTETFKPVEIRAFTCSERNIATSLLRTGTT